jgi:hypothetical protein
LLVLILLALACLLLLARADAASPETELAAPSKPSKVSVSMHDAVSGLSKPWEMSGDTTHLLLLDLPSGDASLPARSLSPEGRAGDAVACQGAHPR